MNHKYKEQVEFLRLANKDQAAEITRLTKELNEANFKMVNFDAIVEANHKQAAKITELEKAKTDMALAMAIAHSQREMFKIKWQRLRNMHLGLRAVLSSLAANSDDFEDVLQDAGSNEGRT